MKADFLCFIAKTETYGHCERNFTWDSSDSKAAFAYSSYEGHLLGIFQTSRVFPVFTCNNKSS